MVNTTLAHVEYKTKTQHYKEIGTVEVPTNGGFKIIRDLLVKKYRMIHTNYRQDSRKNRRYYNFWGCNNWGVEYKVRVWFEDEGVE